ncbi:MAG: phosphatase PAP2 family protein [Bacillota bacterium]
MDQKLFKMINDLAGKNSLVDNIMIFASKKLRYIFAFALIFTWLLDRSYKKVFNHAVISIMINIVINAMVNQCTFRPRPFVTRKANVLIPSKHDSTYTSKHTLLTFAVSTTIFMKNKIYGFIMYGLSVLTGLSRIWTGAHYPYDVIRSAIIGSMVSFVVNRLSRIR